MAEQREPDPDDIRRAHRPNTRLRLNRPGQLWRALTSILLGAVIVYALLFIPLPFFIFKPGTAEAIRPMVQIGRAPGPESGAFMLTTVRVSDSNLVNYVYALLNPYDQLVLKKDVFRNGESEEEYSRRQDFVMLDSQSNAMQAAYNKAGIPYHINNEGVVVLQVLDNMPAAHALKAGDYIVQVDDTPITVRDDLLKYIQGKKAGDTVQVTYKRGNVQKTVPITLATLPPDPDQPDDAQRPGLGVVPADVHSVKADRPEDQVSIEAGEIGGPSAGLMFSLEIYSQLTQQDLTKGYRIAGTGTIDPHGNVGVIGGIQHKVVAADREKADFFFAPKDLYPKPGEQFAPVLNTSDAEAEAKKIRSKMKIVSVGTMDEALDFLRSLPPKSSS